MADNKLHLPCIIISYNAAIQRDARRTPPVLVIAYGIELYCRSMVIINCSQLSMITVINDRCTV